MDNPYASPADSADEPREEGDIGPDIKLFSPVQVGWATFFGSWIAGAVLLSANYLQLKRKRMAVLIVPVGIIGFLVHYPAVHYLGRQSRFFVVLVMTFAMLLLMRKLQGAQIADHFAHHRSGRSNWLVLCAVLIGVLPIMAAVAVALLSNATIA
jgi:hypothetical protein